MSIYASRKRNRLEGDLYRQPGAYFITICTEGKKNLFWQEAPINPSSEHSLSTMGRIADEEILETIFGYGAFMGVDQHIVMPNHVHMLITMKMAQSCTCPDIRYVVRLYKRRVSQRVGRSIWQKGFSTTSSEMNLNTAKYGNTSTKTPPNGKTTDIIPTKAV